MATDLPTPDDRDGPAAARPGVLWLHGFLGRGADWAPIVAALGERFHCVTPDLPGHGTHALDAYAQPLHFRSLAQALIADLDRRRLPRVALVGYSMGGRLALYTALHYPDRVAALVLESASPGLADPAQRAARAALDDRRAADIRRRGLPAFLDDWYAMPLFASLHQHPDLLARLKRERAAIPPEWAARVIAELSPGRQPALWHRLPDLHCPTLLICGARDPKYPALMRRMAAALPNARLHCVPDAGHNVHAERPAAFCQAVRTFFTAIGYG